MLLYVYVVHATDGCLHIESEVERKLSCLSVCLLKRGILILLITKYHIPIGLTIYKLRSIVVGISISIYVQLQTKLRASIVFMVTTLVLKLCFLPLSVRREVKGLSEFLLLFLRHFSDIVIFWKIFKVNSAQILTF